MARFGYDQEYFSSANALRRTTAAECFDQIHKRRFFLRFQFLETDNLLVSHISAFPKLKTIIK